MLEIIRECKIELLTGLLMILFVIGVMVGCIVIDKNRSDKLWNGGYCPVCGSEWEYEQAVGHYHSTTYIYTCNKCGRKIEISEVR